MNIQVAVRSKVFEHFVIETYSKTKEALEQPYGGQTLQKPQERAIRALTQSCGQQNRKNEASPSVVLSWRTIGSVC